MQNFDCFWGQLKPSTLIDHRFNFLKSKIEKSFSIQFLTNSNKMMKSSMFLIFCTLSLILFNEVTESTILTNDRDIGKCNLNFNPWPFYLLRQRITTLSSRLYHFYFQGPYIRTLRGSPDNFDFNPFWSRPIQSQPHLDLLKELVLGKRSAQSRKYD